MYIKTTMRYHLTPIKWPSLRSLQITKAGEGVEKREPSFMAGGSGNWATVENSMDGCSSEN